MKVIVNGPEGVDCKIESTVKKVIPTSYKTPFLEVSLEEVTCAKMLIGRLAQEKLTTSTKTGDKEITVDINCPSKDRDCTNCINLLVKIDTEELSTPMSTATI